MSYTSPSYISPGPGSANQITLSLDVADSVSDLTQGVGALSIAGLQNITINASNDVFTWTQLDATAKKQVATTSTNSSQLGGLSLQSSGSAIGANQIARSDVNGYSYFNYINKKHPCIECLVDNLYEWLSYT